ncbi:MAG: hypothetical protein ACRC1K_11120, partial [Planctomycetia bacterium]
NWLRTAAADGLADLPREADRMLMASYLTLPDLTAVWEIGMVDLVAAIPLAKVAEHEKGKLDTIGARQVVWSPRDAYFVQLTGKQMAMVHPADRQFLGRWLQTQSDADAKLSDYLSEGLALVETDAALVVAIDLTHAISVDAARDRLAKLGVVPLAELDQVAAVAATLRGLTFAIRIDGKPVGRLRLDFENPTACLEKCGQPITLEVLRRIGAGMPDLENWQSSVSGNSLSLRGDVTADGLRQVLSFITTPSDAGRLDKIAAEMRQPPGDAGSPDPTSVDYQKTLRGAASKEYFASVRHVIDDLRNVKSRTMGEKALWNERYALRIDRLPILNVDADLLNFGQEVSGLLRGSGFAIRDSNMQFGAQRSRTVGVTGAFTPLGFYGAGVTASQDAAANLGLRSQMARQGVGTYLRNLNDIDNQMVAVRRVMTERYGLAF